MNKLELFYAKLVFKTDTEKRMAVSRKIASLLRNNFTLMDALHRIEMIESHNGRKPNEPFAIAMREIQQNLERGMTFAQATHGWVPTSWESGTFRSIWDLMSATDRSCIPYMNTDLTYSCSRGLKAALIKDGCTMRTGISSGYISMKRTSLRYSSENGADFLRKTTSNG